jgi:hypothetical protein
MSTSCARKKRFLIFDTQEHVDSEYIKLKIGLALPTFSKLTDFQTFFGFFQVVEHIRDSFIKNTLRALLGSTSPSVCCAS